MKMPRLTAWVLLLLTATGVRAESWPQVTYLGTANRDVIELTVQTGRMIPGHQEAFKLKPGQTLDRQPTLTMVLQDGKVIGYLVGPGEKILYYPDQVESVSFDAEGWDSPQQYSIQSKDDPNYENALKPMAVYRKTKPAAIARTGPWKFEAPLWHTYYLRLPHALSPNKTYALHFTAGGFLMRQAFRFKPTQQRSEAVHVTQIGFRPDDPVKLAYLSTWMGKGGGLQYPQGLSFWVLDDSTGKAVYQGKMKLAKAAGDLTEDSYKHNFQKADVWVADFSEFSLPGKFRVYVEGVGCSFPFSISDDVWNKAFTISARGFYHQRQGIQLGPPYTNFNRPRCLHPDDGVTFFQSKAMLMETADGLDLRKDGGDEGLDKRLDGDKTDKTVPDAWGGYDDAGDWDRRIQHLEATRRLLELYELFPDYFAKAGLNIPESGNGLPDVVNEALFNLDAYRRLQMPDGGVRGGTEFKEPKYGEASWENTQTVMVYAPDPWSSYLYAATAAQAAGVLSPLRPALSATYKKSAIKAFQWADAHLKGPAEGLWQLRDARNLAAVEIFRLTGVEEFHKIFKETSVLSDSAKPLYIWDKVDQREAAWRYLRSGPGADPALQATAKTALLKEADAFAAGCERTAFGWTSDPWAPPGWGMQVHPQGLALARAHFLTRDPKYLRALVLACQCGGGANPLNLCYTTGLGERWPIYALDVDAFVTGKPPRPGLTLFGPQDPATVNKEDPFAKLVRPLVYPVFEDWPILEAFWNTAWYPPLSEFTVMNPMAENAFVWGYLASVKRK